MNQREAVIEAMKANGGYATLGHLYKEALRIPGVVWKTKTPFSSINRIVQEPRYFFRIRPGLWALNEAKDKLPADLRAHPKPESDHTHFQALLVELGNFKNYQTFVPKQDRRRKVMGRNLGDFATMAELPAFSYPDMVRRASAADVVWFDQRRMPVEFIEVENTTDMRGALLRFVELEGFNANFRIVSPASRKAEFVDRIAHPAFQTVAKRTRFTSYDLVAALHSKQAAVAAIESEWQSATG